jgi:hypothetical protein
MVNVACASATERDVDWPAKGRLMLDGTLGNATMRPTWSAVLVKWKN